MRVSLGVVIGWKLGAIMGHIMRAVMIYYALKPGARALACNECSKSFLHVLIILLEC